MGEGRGGVGGVGLPLQMSVGKLHEVLKVIEEGHEDYPVN